MPAVYAVRAAQSMLNMQRLAGFERLMPGAGARFDVVGMNQSDPAPVLELLQSEPRELDPLPVEVDWVARRCRRKDLLGHRFCQKTKTFPRLFRLSKRFLPVNQRIRK